MPPAGFEDHLGGMTRYENFLLYLILQRLTRNGVLTRSDPN